jgi:hypothetical protein
MTEQTTYCEHCGSRDPDHACKAQPIRALRTRPRVVCVSTHSGHDHTSAWLRDMIGRYGLGPEGAR